IRDFHVTGVQTCALPIWRSTSDFMVGPLGSDVKAVLGLTVGNLTQYYDDKDTNASNEAFRLLKNKIPAQNLWYTKAATNRMIFEIGRATCRERVKIWVIE